MLERAVFQQSRAVGKFNENIVYSLPIFPVLFVRIKFIMGTYKIKGKNLISP